MFRTQDATQALLCGRGGIGRSSRVAANDTEALGDLVGARLRLTRDEFLDEAGHHCGLRGAPAPAYRLKPALEFRVESDSQSHGAGSRRRASIQVVVIRISQRPDVSGKFLSQPIPLQATKVIE
jgi:hypothetical protein